MYAAVRLFETDVMTANDDDSIEHYFEVSMRHRRTRDDAYFQRIERLARG